MTEEDIRGRLLLPYINDLGFDASEISLERNFTVRLGRNKHMTGRSDILCKKHNKNLFVIELKNDSVKITQDDIDQGISYARLLDDIAPFTIVSNGVETKIFDSISKEELSGEISDQSVFWKNGCSLSTEEDIKIRYEALKNFISMSPENLKVFCKSQVDDRMEGIVGDLNSPYAKFVKKLYVKRKALQIAFEDFINSDKHIFGLVGAAGTGKTNSLCSLALRKLDDTFVFFYNAAIITSLLDCISQDLNISFSSRVEPDVVLKKLDELGRYSGKDVLIFIDAIDECTNQSITHELSEIALVTKNLNRVKVIISCKSNIWSTMLKVKNTPTHLYHELNKYHQPITDLNNNPGFLLTDFTNEELKTILPLYQSEFGFQGILSESLLNELKNGFFLKIFSEVYSGKPIPEKINDKELIRKYLNQSLQETTIGPLLGLRTLSAIGSVIIKHNYTFWESYKDEGLDINHILEKLNFSLDENIPEDLFTRNILIKSNNDESYNISFYYSKIRDYIICFHTYQLDKLDNHQFYDVLTDFYENHIGKSAIDFYVENADTSHLNTLVNFKKDKSLNYVIGYDSYLEDNLKKIKKKFNPKTDGDIGILLPGDLIKNDGYALIHLSSESESKIIYGDLSNVFSQYFDSTEIQKMGVQIIHSSIDSLLVKDQNSVIKKNVFKQLKKIIEDSKISVYNSSILFFEQVSLFLYFYHKKLNYDYEIAEYYLPRFESIYPIDLNDLRNRLYKFIATEHYKKNKIASSEIDQIVEESLRQNIDIPKLYITGDYPPFEELFKIVNILLSNGYDKLENHFLPYPNKSIVEVKEWTRQNDINDIGKMISAQYSSNQAQIYLESFFKQLEIAYQEFVEYCFPKLKDQLPFFKTLPHEYIFYMKNSDILQNGWYGYHASKSGNTKTYITELKESIFRTSFKDDDIISLSSFSFEDILYNNSFHNIKTLEKINTYEVDRYCVIRNWIYRLLRDDMKDLFKEN